MINFLLNYNKINNKKYNAFVFKIPAEATVL